MISPIPLESDVAVEPVVRAKPGKSYWQESWERLRSNRFGIAAGLVLVLFVLVAITSPLLAALFTHTDYRTIDLANPFAPPLTQHHILGTDDLGRDELTRLLFGAQVSMGIGFLAVFVALTIGAAVGLVAGYYGSLIDGALMRFVDMLLAIPGIFLFILMALLFKPNTITLALIIASVGWGSIARLVRGEVLSVRTRDFMVATKSLGASDARLIARHLLPNVLHVLIVYGSLYLGQVILIEAALDFLGLGINPPTPSWGNMLTNSETFFFHSSWLVVWPGITIFLSVLAANLFGNALRDAFDPR
ncbi:MAG TPA: ABC transporter permease, partial [Candidatus Dormibacteraeota bacterium]|nr:ABC transporter permease [Candidatus Dormibacteraeota bacterium]